MYRLMIVEDEAAVLQALCTLIPWEDIGFKVAFCAENAIQAQEILSRETCDVILTDIVMSGKNGLELAQFVHENMPQIKVVILSGYSEFSYAQEAMKYGVIDYLVKPIDEMALIDIFKKICFQLDKENLEHKNMKKTEDVKVNLEAAFIKLLLSGQIESQYELFTNLRLLDIPLDCAENPLFIYTLIFNPISEDDTESLEIHADDIRTILKQYESLGFLCLFLPIADGIINIAVFQPQRLDSSLNQQELCWHEMEKIRDGIETQYRVSVSMNKTVYKSKLIDMIENRDDLTESQNNQGKAVYDLLLEYARLFIAALDSHDMERAEVLFDRLFKQTRAFADVTLRLFCKDLLYSIIIHYSLKNKITTDIFTEDMSIEQTLSGAPVDRQIGRASCRERV